MGKPKAAALRHIVDTVSAMLDSLSHLGTEKDITHALIIHLTLTKIDSASKAKWDEHLEYKNLPQWSDCASMLIKRCQYLEINEKSVEQRQGDVKVTGNKLQNRNAQSFSCAQNITAPKKCTFCLAEEHNIVMCNSFLAASVENRFKFIKENKMCINCLKSGHTVSKCRSARCTSCHRPHHNLLDRFMPNENQFNANNESRLQSTVQSMYACQNEDQVVLATAIVEVKNKNGIYQPARALLDSGSQVHFITENLAQALQLKREKTILNIQCVDNTGTKTKAKLQAIVKSRICDFSFTTDFYVIKTISEQQPPNRLYREELPIPCNLVLADPYFHKPQKVDLLIGEESFFELLSIGQIKLGPNMPTLQKTLLGWTVSGKCSSSEFVKTKNCNLVTSIECIDNSLNQIVEKFWELEEIPIRKNFSAEHEACENHFVNTIRQLPNGRFEVRLPFKSDPMLLGSSFETAKQRFLSLERRLNRNLELKSQYISFMKEYLALGHMSPTNDKVPDIPHYFIPHQCILRPESATTKLRVVFAASCKTTSNISLNDILMVGPTIQDELFSTLIRFRLHKYAITADITKMYRQFQINEKDRNFQLIIWRENTMQSIQIFRLNTITYGTASAPFLAIRCLKEISNSFTEKFPLGAAAIAKDFYVDDLLSGANSIDSLELLRSEIITIFDSCGIKLTKWFSNHPHYLNEKSKNLLNFNNVDSTKTLGIIWDLKNDVFKFRFSKTNDSLKVTKRNILSMSSRLFDPLGVLGPIVIKAKMILQELWLNKLNWDESVPQHLETAWNSFKQEFSELSLISVPRCVNLSTNHKVQIHGFADASIRAYGCCLYVRSVTGRTVTVRLLTAKSKVAPIKTKTLPRLELCAVHLLAKLWSSVQNLIFYEIESVTFWTDSEIVLHWLKSHSSSLSTFVGNRVAEVQELSSSIFWRHVPSAHNPADIISRGCNVQELLSSIWFEGPLFLKDTQEIWPKNTLIKIAPEIINLEKKKSQFTLMSKIVTNTSKNTAIRAIEKYSSYKKIIRIFAYVYRFLGAAKARTKIRRSLNTKTFRTEIPFTPHELHLAFLKIVELIQHMEFSEEIRTLKSSQTLKSHLQKLCPFVQEYNEDWRSFSLLRVGGRLLNAPIDQSAKFPLILNKNSHFIKIYLRYLHIENLHAGPKVLVSLLRQNIWLVNAREVARKTVKECVICFKFKPILLSQMMGNLPTDRFAATRSFFVSGVDIFGPIFTTLKIRGRPPVKTYVAVFICFSSKAVHLEALSDLSTNCFLSCLARFAARRGLPKKIWCDNATNFVGAANFLNFQCLQEASEKGIEIQFIPPRAPHFGGLWEAAVKSAKHLLLRSVGYGLLTFEELTTMLAEVEAILNSRPITTSEDPNDGEALTPGHLLIGGCLKALPSTEKTTRNTTCLKRYRQLSSLKARFWDAWLKDYVLAQQQRSKWFEPNNNITIGTVVMVHEDNLPPQNWLIGKISNVILGSDGKARVVEIETRSGKFKRVIHKVAPLPIHDSQASSVALPCNAGGMLEQK